MERVAPKIIWWWPKITTHHNISKGESENQSYVSTSFSDVTMPRLCKNKEHLASRRRETNLKGKWNIICCLPEAMSTINHRRDGLVFPYHERKTHYRARVLVATWWQWHSTKAQASTSIIEAQVDKNAE